MNKQKSVETSGESILQALDERIEMLQNIKVAIRYAWGIERTPEPLRGEEAGVRQVQHERQQRLAKPAKPAKKQPSARTKTATGNRDAIYAVLRRAGGPLSPSEIFNRLNQRGWQTTSGKPRELIGVTLRSMWMSGKLNRVGGDYELPPTAQQEQAPSPETTMRQEEEVTQ